MAVLFVVVIVVVIAFLVSWSSSVGGIIWGFRGGKIEAGDASVAL
jgi:hypothetical protein